MITAKVLFAKGMVTIDARENHQGKAQKITRIARGHQGNGRGGKGNRGERWERCTEGVHVGVWGPTCWHGAEKPRNHQTCNVGNVIWQLIR